MNDKKINPVQVWKQMEDLLAPQLSFSLSDRAVYSHLLRHSRLEGKLQFQFSIPWLAHGVGVTSKTARDAVRRLIARGVLHLVERNTQAHHVVRLRLPSEVRAVRAAKIAPYRPAPAPHAAVNLEEEDFLRTRPLRQAIHEIGGGLRYQGVVVGTNNPAIVGRETSSSFGGPSTNVDRYQGSFEPFFRSDPSRDRNTGGAGLGLAIVEAIARAHGGRAEVAETRGGGATFRVFLPKGHGEVPAD